VSFLWAVLFSFCRPARPQAQILRREVPASCRQCTAKEGIKLSTEYSKIYGQVGEWVEVREPETGKLLFRYAPRHHLVEIQRRRVVTVVDLTKYQEEEKPD